MPDKTDETSPERGGGVGRILRGLAATAMLGAPVVAAASAAAEPATAAPTSASSTAEAGQSAAGRSMRDQFRDSFTPGSVSDLAAAPKPVVIIDR